MGLEKEIKAKEDAGDIAGLEATRDEAQSFYDTETMTLATEAIERLKANLDKKVEKDIQPVQTTSSEVARVKSLGGSEDVINEVVAPIDQEIAKKDEAIASVGKDAKTEINNVAAGGTQVENIILSEEDQIRHEFSIINAESKSLKERNDKIGLSGDDKKRFEELSSNKKEVTTRFLKTISAEEANNIPLVEGVKRDTVLRTIAFNKLLNLNLPIDGKDLSTYEIKGKNYLSIAGGDPRAENEKSNLAKSQMEIFVKIKLASENIKNLPKELKDRLSAEVELEKSILFGESDQDNPISSLYMKFGEEYGKSFIVINPKDEFYPESIEGFGQKFSPLKMREFMSKNYKIGINLLLLEKRARETGLI